jgi:hypothetical protein
MVILPKFKVMADFARRYEEENLAGKLNMNPIDDGSSDPGVCNSCGEFPCICSCRKCGHKPCRCYIVLDSQSVTDGGQIASVDVSEKFIERARIIRDSSPAHQHANVVQLGDALQRSAQMGETPLIDSLNDRRQLAWDNINRKIRTIATHFYGGDIAAAWVNEIHDKFGTNADEIKSTWRVAQIKELHDHLKNRIAEGL